jgi:hypothetical protein
MTDHDLTSLAVSIIVFFESKGWAVAMFNPPELQHVDPRRVSEVMIEAGWRAIDAGQSDGGDD